MTQAALDLSSDEPFLCRRLREQRYVTLVLDVNPACAREQVRTAIVEAGCDCTIVGRDASGKTETYAQAFARVYGEPLIRKPSRKGKRHVAHA